MSPWDKGKIIFSKITLILLEDCWSNHGVSWFHEVLQQSSSTISPKAALGMACLGSTAQLRRPRCSAWKDTENSWSNRECSKHRNIFVERLWEGFFCPQAENTSYDISIGFEIMHANGLTCLARQGIHWAAAKAPGSLQTGSKQNSYRTPMLINTR